MQLEEFRRIRLDELATLIQKTYRAWAARWLFLKRKQAQIQIATAWRRYKVTIQSIFIFPIICWVVLLLFFFVVVVVVVNSSPIRSRRKQT